MATNVRGRSGVRSRSTYGGYQSVSTRTGSTNWHRTSTPSKGLGTRTKGTSMGGNVPVAWKSCSDSFINKMNSYKMLYNQTKGPAKHQRPSPTTLNTFANWIGKGAVIQTVSAAQVNRWAKTARKNFNTRTPTPNACKSVLCAKFGKTTIKAVARSKSGSFMVATAPTVKGKCFCFPK